VLRSFQTALSRSSQWVEPQPITKTTGAHHANPANTIAAVKPATMPTRPSDTNCTFSDMGGAV
jgi:hypothetical protein